jgi:hypothetical protein
MEKTDPIGETPLPLQIKDTLSVIFGQMPLKSLGQCARVSKRWKEVTDHFILLDELDLQPKNQMATFQYASLALNKFQYAKKVKLPKRLYSYLNSPEEKTFFNEIYPKGVKNVTALSFPASMDSLARNENARAELAHLILDPLPKSCVHFDFVSFWPEFFELMTKNHAENLKSLHILLNTGGKIAGSWDSLYSLAKHATRLESLGLHYFDHARFYSGDPNFQVLSDNLAHVLQLATQLQHLNIPYKFNIDSVVKKMDYMPNLTHLYIQEKMTNTLPSTLLEKCSKLQFLHLQLDNRTEQYHIASKTLQTLIIDSKASLNSVTIECPNLEVLKFTPPQAAWINDVFIVGENKIKEFTSKTPITNIHGNFSSVKKANHHSFLNSEQLDSMTALEELNLECEAPKTQAIYNAMNMLHHLTNLRCLDLTKVQRCEDLVNNDVLSQLTKLVFKNCGINSNEFSFVNFTNLKELHIQQSSSLTTLKISGCHQLSNLVLFDNQSFRTLEIKDSPNLESVDVRNCALNLSSWRQIEKLPNLHTLLATVIPMSSYLKITGQSPLITLSANKVMDRVYQGSIAMLGTRMDWLSKEEYDESGPNIRIRKIF